MDGGTEAAGALISAFSGATALDAMDGNDADMNLQRSASVAEGRSDGADRIDPRIASNGQRPEAERRGSTPLLAGGLWKVQSMERGGGAGRSPPALALTGLGKKKPILPINLGARGTGAVWRENSTPAAARSF